MQAKRWLSGLVACAMLVTMLPTQVFALESDAPDTWDKTLNAEELYALIQDDLDENGSIGLADLADSEAGTDTNDGVQGTLTAVAFDSGDKIELSALADGDTSYTLTFTDDDTSEPDSGLPAETGDMTEPPQEDGQPVAPGATPADDSTASDTTSGTDPPTAEEPSAQGQEGTVDLRVTTQETYATEAEADAQAAEQGKDPEADVAVQTDEATGTVLGALLTVDEEQVDAVTLYYTAEKAEEPIRLMNLLGQENEPEPRAEGRIPTFTASRVEDISNLGDNHSSNDFTVAAYIWQDAKNSDLFYIAVAAGTQHGEFDKIDTNIWEVYEGDQELKISVNGNTTGCKPSDLGKTKTNLWLIADFQRDEFENLQKAGENYKFTLGGLPGGFELFATLPGNFVEEVIRQKDGKPIYVEVYVDGTQTEDELASYVEVATGDDNLLTTTVQNNQIKCDYGVYTVTIKRGSSLTQSNLTDVLADPGYYFTGWQNANVTYSESELLGRTFDTDTAFTAQYQTMPNQIIVNYDDDGSGYGEVTSDHRQVFTADNWQTITGDPTHVRIHLTATAEDDGGRTYFDEWQGSLVDGLDDDIREDEELSAWVVAEIGQTYTVIADFGRRSSGGGGGGGNRDDDDDEEEIIDEEVPLAETPWLNTVDHYAYIVGYAEDGTVRPNANITRAEVATIFFRLLTDEARNSLWSTTNTFSDVASTAWYNTAVSTMANAGIIQGYEDGTFRPNANITRAEFAAIAARFMTSGYDVESDLFTDIAGHWARESINDAATAGWINGYSDDTFRPDNAITRAEAVTLVNNVLQRKPDADHMLDSMITWPDNPESAWYYEAIQEATNSHDYDMPSEDDDVDYETWTALQENRDWAALEAQWSAEHAYGGDVM